MINVYYYRYRLFHLALILLMALHETVVAESDPCPCFCDDNHRMNCANQRWKVIPFFVPPRVTVINLQVNNVREINKNAFGGDLKNLTLLRLDKNKIRTIDSGAFNGLPKLDRLVLDNNRIDAFDVVMLDPASPLKGGISLKNNRLKTFPLSVLVKYKSPINVNSNRIRCDCLSVIPDELKRFVSGTCNLPGYVKGKSIRSLTYKDVRCDECINHKCVHGFCYSRGGTPSCSCIHGYSGNLCEIKDTTTNINTKAPTTIGPTLTKVITTPITPATTKTTTSNTSTIKTPKTSKRPKTPPSIKESKVSCLEYGVILSVKYKPKFFMTHLFKIYMVMKQGKGNNSKHIYKGYFACVQKGYLKCILFKINE